MSTYVLMKILESAPDRYDRGIRILTLGKLDKIYDNLTSHLKTGQRVLDIGCGTGILTVKAAKKGAQVRGIDVNPQMLEIAQKRVNEEGVSQNVKLSEMGVAELGNEKDESYDIVMSGLCFSELAEDELCYTLKEINRLLKPGGLLLVADEVKPVSFSKKILNVLVRLPLKAITYLLTQTTTNAVDNLPDKVRKAGLQIVTVRLNGMQNFIELAAVKDVVLKE
ncbi:2-methoxy-6-polyprenyl-1,4-benzoquinol methylase, mitochondrial [subsurface metagenome]